MKRLAILLFVLALSSVAVFAGNLSCTESGDSGFDIFTPGSITWSTPGQSQTDYDTCDGQSTNILEYWCEGDHHRQRSEQCPYGCVIVSDGPDYCGPNPIPEFSTLAAGIALAGATAGFIFLRRRK